MVSIEEYPFIFMNTPASLQVLASAEIALTIWRHELANTSCDNAVKILHSKKKPRCKEVLDVSVPQRIRAQIDKKIGSIGKELKQWIDFHSSREFFDGGSTEAFFNCSKHIVVDFSVSIGYKATAINMLNSGEFNDAVNYKISCTFCLEDQVKRFWPAVANNPPIDSNFCKCNLSYWNGLMKVGNSITDTELVELRMMEADALNEIHPRDRYYGTAFEYFCKMLPDDARISEIISWLLVERGHYQAVTLTCTLSTLDRVQAEKVFKQRASKIFTILMMNDNYFQFAHQLWTLMGHLVLENESEFSHVVFELWHTVFEPDRTYIPDLSFIRCDQINDLLLEIWSNTSDELKARVSDTFWRNDNILFTPDSRMQFFYRRPKFSRSGFASYYGHDMTFMLEMLSKLRDLDKKQLWQKYWQGLALHSKPLYLEQFMRICLPNDDEIELFKNEIADYDDLFKSLIEEGFYSDLKDYLLFCSTNAEHFQQLGKKVLGSNLYLISFHDYDKFAKFEWFVGEVFVNIELEEFKTQMISSPECVKHLLRACQADKISSKNLIRIIRRFVNDEDELPLVKRKLFEHCREHPAETCFNADEWQEFLVWCTDADHDEISAFKRSLNVDVIFLNRLEDYLLGVEGESFFRSLHFLGNFLDWYFGNEQDAKNFKLEKVKNYKQIDILRVRVDNKGNDRIKNTLTF